MPKRRKYIWNETSTQLMEQEGPYECPNCGGHVILDATFLDQVSEKVTCPYCKKPVWVPEIKTCSWCGNTDCKKINGHGDLHLCKECKRKYGAKELYLRFRKYYRMYNYIPCDKCGTEWARPQDVNYTEEEPDCWLCSKCEKEYDEEAKVAVYEEYYGDEHYRMQP